MDQYAQTHGFSVMLTSLSIILLTFFIYLNSISSANSVKEEAVRHSIELQFPQAKNPAVLSRIAEIMRLASAKDIHEGPAAEPQSRLQTSVVSGLREAGARLEASPGIIVAAFSADSIFAAGDDQIRAGMLEFFSRTAAEMARSDLLLEIQSHADDTLAPGRRFADKWELTAAQAASVYRLFRDAGVPAQRLQAGGFAQYRPIAPNDSAQGQEKNRRLLMIFRSPQHKNPQERSNNA